MNKKANKVLVISTIIFILVVALLLRLAKINTNLIFTYDQGRDALVIQRILQGHFTLIGPTTGIAGVFLGPFFYYFIILPYWFFGGNPMSVVIFLNIFVLLGMLVTALIAKGHKGWAAFFICLVLLATNYSNIRFSRWLSNPNPILWLAPLFYYLVIQYFTSDKKKILGINYEILLGVTLGLLFQTELANALFFLPTFVIIWVVLRKKFLWQSGLKILVSFVLIMLPLFIFNLRHNFIMIHAFQDFTSQTSEKVSLLAIVKSRPTFYLTTLTTFITPKRNWLFLALLVIVTYFLIKVKFWRQKKLIILVFWLVIPLLLMLFYTFNRGTIWDYYLISQPIPFLALLSLALADLIKQFKKLGYVLVVSLICLLSLVNLKEWQILISDEANLISYGNMIKTIDSIYEQAQGKPFNVEVFVPNLLPAKYEYLLSWYGKHRYGYEPSVLPQQEKLLFYIIEDSGVTYESSEQFWLRLWYDERYKIGKVVKKTSYGEIDLETRQR